VPADDPRQNLVVPADDPRQKLVLLHGEDGRGANKQQVYPNGVTQHGPLKNILSISVQHNTRYV
jgi:hypothetical protein